MTLESRIVLGNLKDHSLSTLVRYCPLWALALMVLFFELFPQNVSYQLDVIHAYILISLPIPNRCGTFVRLLGVYPTILPSNKVQRASPKTSISFSSFEHTRYMKHHLQGRPTTSFCSASTHTIMHEPSSDTTCWETS